MLLSLRFGCEPSGWHADIATLRAIYGQHAKTKLLAPVRATLYERPYVIPALRTLGELAKHAREKVEHEVSATIERTLSPAARARWVERYRAKYPLPLVLHREIGGVDRLNCSRACATASSGARGMILT
jgi:hypothetical protein